MAQYGASGAAYYLSDALGSVRQLMNASGEVTLAKNYEPYGEVLSSAGGVSTTYGYTGEFTDASGLIYLRARYLAPGAGRFLHQSLAGGLYQTINVKWLELCRSESNEFR